MADDARAVHMTRGRTEVDPLLGGKVSDSMADSEDKCEWMKNHEDRWKAGLYNPAPSAEEAVLHQVPYMLLVENCFLALLCMLFFVYGVSCFFMLPMCQDHPGATMQIVPAVMFILFLMTLCGLQTFWWQVQQLDLYGRKTHLMLEVISTVVAVWATQNYPYLAQWVWTPLLFAAILSVIVLSSEVVMLYYNSMRDSPLRKARLVRAISGVRYLKLSKHYQFYHLAQAIYVFDRRTESCHTRKIIPRWLSKSRKQVHADSDEGRRLLDKEPIPQYVLGPMADGTNDDPDTHLFIGEEVGPDKFELECVQIPCYDAEGKPAQKDILKDLFDSKARQSTDFLKANEGSFTFEEKPVRSNKNEYHINFNNEEIMEWIWKGKQASDRSTRQGHHGWAKLRRINYYESVLDTWAVKIGLLAVFSLWLLVPSCCVVQLLLRNQHNFCEHGWIGDTLYLGDEFVRQNVNHSEGLAAENSTNSSDVGNLDEDEDDVWNYTGHKAKAWRSKCIRNESDAWGRPVDIWQARDAFGNESDWKRDCEKDRHIPHHWKRQCEEKELGEEGVKRDCEKLWAKHSDAPYWEFRQRICRSIAWDSKLRRFLDTPSTSLFMTPLLSFVVCFMICVALTQREHLKHQEEYFAHLPEKQEAIEQVLDLQSTIENTLSIPAVLTAFFNGLRGSPNAQLLKACRPLQLRDLRGRADRGLNGCLDVIAGSVLSMHSSVDIEVFRLPRMPLKGDDADKVEKRTPVVHAWDHKVELYDMDTKNVKVSVDIEIKYKETWQIVWDHLIKSPNDPLHLNKLVGKHNHQDGSGDVDVHVKENLQIGSQIIPKGFCLTHFWSTTSGGDLVQVALHGTEEENKSYEDWVEALKPSETKTCPTRRRSVSDTGSRNSSLSTRLNQASDAVDVPVFKERGHMVRLHPAKFAVKLWKELKNNNYGTTRNGYGQAEDFFLKTGEGGSQDMALPSFYMSFQLTEDYHAKHHEFPDSNKGKHFGDDVGHGRSHLVCQKSREAFQEMKEMTNEAPQQAELSDTDAQRLAAAVARVTKEFEAVDEREQASCTLLVGKANTWRMQFQLLWILASWLFTLFVGFSLPFLCGWLHRDPKLENLAWWKMRTHVAEGVALSCFFLFMRKVQLRLGVVQGILQVLHSRTLDPTGDYNSDEHKDKSGKKTSSKGEHEGEIGDHSCAQNFYLYCHATEPYKPNSDSWDKKWDHCFTNVSHWSASEKYLRVFTSSVRLSSQAVLAVSMWLILIMALMAFAQAWSGMGAVAIDRNAMMSQAEDDMSGVFSSSMAGMKEDFAKMMKDAAEAQIDTSKKPRKLASGLSGMAVGGLSGRGDHLAAAEASLRQTLLPFSEVVRSPARAHVRQLQSYSKAADKAKQYMKNVHIGDIQSVTMVQLMTMMLLAAIALFSTPLIYRVASLNDAFDRNAGLLLQAKNKHAHRQRRREKEMLEKRRLMRNRAKAEYSIGDVVEVELPKEAEGSLGGIAVAEIRKIPAKGTYSVSFEEPDIVFDPTKKPGDIVFDPKKTKFREVVFATEDIAVTGLQLKKDARVKKGELLNFVQGGQQEEQAEFKKEDGSKGGQQEEQAEFKKEDGSKVVVVKKDFKKLAKLQDIDKDAIVDAGCAKVESMLEDDNAMMQFEKALDTAIATSTSSQKELPLTLFGFAIRTGIMVTYITIPLVSVAHQAQAMAPKLAEQACLHLDKVPFFQLFNSTLNKGVDKMSHGHDVDVKKWFEQTVCVAFVKVVKEAADDFGDKVDKAAAQDHSRRLADLQSDIPTAVHTWWERTSEDPEAKLRIVTTVLQEFHLNTSRVLRSAECVVKAFSNRGLEAAMLTAAEEYEADFEPEHSQYTVRQTEL